MAHLYSQKTGILLEVNDASLRPPKGYVVNGSWNYPYHNSHIDPNDWVEVPETIKVHWDNYNEVIGKMEELYGANG